MESFFLQAHDVAKLRPQASVEFRGEVKCDWRTKRLT
jgi:hypothetical protein